MYLEEPHLLFHFALADLGLLCGDPRITTQHVRSMMRAKYGIHCRRLLHVLKIEHMNEVLRSPDVQMRRASHGINIDFTSILRSTKARRVSSHFQEPNKEGHVRTHFPKPSR